MDITTISNLFTPYEMLSHEALSYDQLSDEMQTSLQEAMYRTRKDWTVDPDNPPEVTIINQTPLTLEKVLCVLDSYLCWSRVSNLRIPAQYVATKMPAYVQLSNELAPFLLKIASQVVIATAAIFSRNVRNVALIGFAALCCIKAAVHLYYNNEMSIDDKETLSGACKYLHHMGKMADVSHKKALEFFKKELYVRNKLHNNKADKSIVDNLHTLAVVSEKATQYDLAIEYLTQEVTTLHTLYQDATQDDKDDFFFTMGDIIKDLTALKQPAKSVEILNKIAQIAQAVPADKLHPEVGYLFLNLGNYYLESKEYEKALHHYELGLAADYLLYGNKPQIHIANKLTMIGNSLFLLERYTEALSRFKQALKMFPQEYQRDNFGTFTGAKEMIAYIEGKK